MTKTVAFYTLGCKVNQYESRHLEEQFRAGGYTVVDPSEPALVYVVNTCTVTRFADRKSRQFMRRAKRQNPDSIVVMMGCYPQTNPDETAQIPEADIILDNEEKKLAFHRVEAYVKQDVSQRCSPSVSPARKESPAALPPDSPTRALLKIQDGCDRFCSYCVIPYARGPVRSRPMEEILREAEALIRTGYRELVLTGINTALYGADLQESNHGVASVIDELCRLPGDFRIRLGSLEPTVVDAAYVEKLLVYDKLCHHLHLSVQSGSDRILKEMNRHYTVADYLRIVRVVRDADPTYGLTTDIITGFPGET
ncbi:MAG TPA: MiaB/RimO family radical SAM methylthiotransferase, partial [Anaerovoracaceae bacterium]|nr:MiaB/RimO family radical SAM methylthiotransferase [Anaerovoracaceae bacterium]